MYVTSSDVCTAIYVLFEAWCAQYVKFIVCYVVFDNCLACLFMIYALGTSTD